MSDDDRVARYVWVHVVLLVAVATATGAALVAIGPKDECGPCREYRPILNAPCRDGYHRIVENAVVLCRCTEVDP